MSLTHSFNPTKWSSFAEWSQKAINRHNNVICELVLLRHLNFSIFSRNYFGISLILNGMLAGGRRAAEFNNMMDVVRGRLHRRRWHLGVLFSSRDVSRFKLSLEPFHRNWNGVELAENSLESCPNHSETFISDRMKAHEAEAHLKPPAIQSSFLKSHEVFYQLNLVENVLISLSPTIRTRTHKTWHARNFS